MPWDRFADELTISTATVRRRLIFSIATANQRSPSSWGVLGRLLNHKAKKKRHHWKKLQAAAPRDTFLHTHTTLSQNHQLDRYVVVTTKPSSCSPVPWEREVCTADVLLVPYTCLWCLCGHVLAVASSRGRRKLNCRTIRLMSTGGFKHKSSALCAGARQCFFLLDPICSLLQL